MKTLLTGIVFLSVLGFASCKKEVSTSGDLNKLAIQQAVIQTESVAVANSSSTAGDSIYIVHTCNRNEKLAAIDFTTLSTTITGYLNTNYSGYTASKAYSIQNSAGAMTGYITVIEYNGNPVGIKFDSVGQFVRVLEQREGRDLLGEGWHHGGCFDDRDGMHRDSVALSSLPSAIITYMSGNYPGDTLLYAFVKRSGDYIVLSRNNGLSATIFTSGGTFVSHTQLPVFNCSIVSVGQSSLASGISNYLDATYPGYVFERAFSVFKNGSLTNYWVIIDANNTKYAMLFDASGKFVMTRIIW